MKKNLIAAAICGLGLLASGAASAVVIDGVDFGAQGSVSHFETANVIETYVNAVGQPLTGYGRIAEVNFNSNYGSGQSLYFVFRNYTVTSFNNTTGQATFNGGIIDVYLGALGSFLDNTSQTNIANIQGLKKYVEFIGHPLDSFGNTLTANGVLTGASLSFSGEGLLDVSNPNFGSVAAYNYLNPSNQPDRLGGFSDVTFTSSGNTRFHLPKDTCDANNPQPGQFCITGSSDFRGDTVPVPEPSVVALLGLGLMGIGASLRKRKSV